MKARLAIDAISVIACAGLLAAGLGFASSSSRGERMANGDRGRSSGVRSSVSSKDAKVSLAEVDAFAALRFDRLDRGDKGYLTLDDFRAYARGFLDDALTDRHPAAGKSTPPYEVAYRAINKARDGHLTKAEYLSASRARVVGNETGKAER